MINAYGYEMKDGVQCAKMMVTIGGPVPYGKGIPSEIQWWNRDRTVNELLRLGKNYYDLLLPVLRNWPGMTPGDTVETVKESVRHLLYRLPDVLIAKLAHDLCDYGGSVFHGKYLLENHCEINGITNGVLFACWPELKVMRDRYDEGTCTWS
jgi:hypothetical protein